MQRCLISLRGGKSSLLLSSSIANNFQFRHCLDTNTMLKVSFMVGLSIAGKFSLGGGCGCVCKKTYHYDKLDFHQVHDSDVV